MTTAAGDALSHVARRHGYQAIFLRLGRDEFTACPTATRAWLLRTDSRNRSALLCIGRMSYRGEPRRCQRPFHNALLAKTMTLVAMTYVISIIK
jgi:hypothetical protein